MGQDRLYFQIWTVLSHIILCVVYMVVLSIVGLFDNGTAVCLYEWVKFCYLGLCFDAGSNRVSCSLHPLIMWIDKGMGFSVI